MTNSQSSLSLSSPLRHGSIVVFLQRRALLYWLAAALIGLLPSVFGLAPEWQAAGLGMWIPGGGYLFAGAPLLFLLSLVLFVAALAGWLLMGGFLYPVLVWALTLAHAAYLARDGGDNWAQWGVPSLAIAAVLGVCLKVAWGRPKARQAAAKVQHLLAATPLQKPDDTCPAITPLDKQELGALRFTLDLALQPIDQFEGFIKIDQFREAAWRYQLVSINHSLGILQTSRLPAFSGYLHEAQRRSIKKMLDRRVWHYWRVESLIGNFRYEANPINRENIMYTGWWALALAAFERATGDLMFSEKGALPFRENAKTTWNYDFPSVAQVLARNFDDHRLCFFPCEPNWVFTVCNLYGMTGLLTFDKVHGTSLGRDRLAHFLDILETEFTSADGNTAMIMSNRTGFVVRSEDFNVYLSVIPLMNMVSPRLAQVYWQIGVSKMVEQFGQDPWGWQASPTGRIDPGNYQRNESFFWGNLMRAARELGHDAIYDVAVQRYDALGIVERNGALHWSGSVFSQLNGQMGRFATKDAWHRLANGEVPASIGSGPRLEEVSYPDIIVAGADNDGQSLDLVLCAGRKPGLQKVGIGRLQPGRTYSVTNSDVQVLEGGQFVAGNDGTATLSMFVGERTKISVSPLI